MHGWIGPKNIDTIEIILLKRDFPRLNWDTFEKWSEATVGYNCFAFAVGDITQRWWPGVDGAHWPDSVPVEESIAAFIAAFATRGYEVCNISDLEQGYEKIALFANNATKKPTHAAHQLPSGKWESKLGAGIDIQHHTLDELVGPLYGSIACFLKRPFAAETQTRTQS